MKKVIFTMIIALFLGACTSQFEEANKNPYQISGESLTQDFNHIGAYYSSMLSSFYGDQDEDNLTYEAFTRHMATPTPFDGEINNTTYYPRYNSNWGVCYSGVMAPSQQVIKIAKAGNYEVFLSWAKLIRILSVSRLTAIYGPVIYSNYGSSDADILYDKESVLYNTFFSQLDSINTVLKANADYKGLKNFDKCYEGDVTKWIKVVNSMRLRLAIRISKVDPALAKTQGEKAINDGVILINDDNFNINLYGAIFPLARICYLWDDTRMDAAMESFLVGLKDGRISKFFAPVSDMSLVSDHPDWPYKGIRNGAILTDKSLRVGFSKINESFNTVTERRFLTAAEMHFDLAEASLRGWIGAGVAQTNYENGVKASFVDWGANGVDAYLADNTSKPINYKDPVSTPINDFISRSSITVQWNEGDSKELKLEKIITQKWIDCFTNTLESWCDHRRTGYPKLPYNYVNTSNADYGVIAPNDFIKRMPYVTSERTGNPAGVADGTAKLGGQDLVGTRLWFDTGGSNF